jgi:predicted glycogen debranching enzyme
VGKAVEINALWHGALCLMTKWAQELNDNADFADQARRVYENFRAKFWNPAGDCLYDLVGDPKIRPNQIFAVSLPFDLLDKRQQQSVVRVVHRELLTPVGLRTLERGDPDYQPRYQGPPEQRDAAYHQGTVWPGLVEGLERAAADAGCVGAIAEIYDADEPRYPKGCPAQAWSMAEIARLKTVYGFR